jgi:hypothetical protein
MHGILEIVTCTRDATWARYPLLGLKEILEIGEYALQAIALTISCPYKVTTQVHV